MNNNFSLVSQSFLSSNNLLPSSITYFIYKYISEIFVDPDELTR